MPQKSPRGVVDPDRLAELVSNSGLSHKKTARSYVFRCPLCGKPDKLLMFKASGFFVCVVCRDTQRFSGAPEFAFRHLLGVSLNEARRLLYGEGAGSLNPGRYIDLAFAEDVDDETATDALDPQDAIQPVAWDWHCALLTRPAATPGVEYLESRGVPYSVALQYQIRYSTMERALAFPVYFGDVLVGWQYRSIDPEYVATADGWYGKRLRYRSTKDLPRDRTLMFAHRLENAEHAVLCEGPFDALKAHLMGGNVATAGKVVGGKQLDLLLRAGVRRVYVALDPDAVQEAQALLYRLEGAEVYIVEVPKPYKDLGEMPMEEARDAILGSSLLDSGRIYAGAL